MHASLTLGPHKVHVFTVVPGRAGEPQRLAQALADLDALCVAAEVDAGHALALRQRLAGARAEVPFLARLACEETARQHRGGADDVFLAAARHARTTQVPFVPLLPSAREPGFFERRRLRRLAREIPTGRDEVEYSKSLEATLRRDGGLQPQRAAGDLEAARRITELVFEEERTRVAVVLSAARAERILDAFRSLAPRRAGGDGWPDDEQAARASAANQQVKRHEPYPPYR